MKYLQRFNELKSSTYHSAAKKLGDLGHVNRSGDLTEWGTKVADVEKAEKEKQEKLKWSKNEPFDIIVCDTTWVAGNPGRHVDNEIMRGKFYIDFEYEWDMFSDQYWDWSVSNYDYSLWMSFIMGILPADEETSIEFNNNENIKSGLWGVSLWPQWLVMCIANEGEVALNVTPNRFGIDTINHIKYRFETRQDAIRFKKYFVSEMSGQTNNTNIRNRIEKQIGLIKTDENYRRNIPDDFMDRLVKNANRMSLNILYKEQ